MNESACTELFPSQTDSQIIPDSEGPPFLSEKLAEESTQISSPRKVQNSQEDSSPKPDFLLEGRSENRKAIGKEEPRDFYSVNLTKHPYNISSQPSSWQPWMFAPFLFGILAGFLSTILSVFRVSRSPSKVKV